MEKLLFVVRSLKERLGEFFLHENEDFREQILNREEKGKKASLSAYGTKRKSDFGKN
jgi:hypothetical protein